MEIKFKKERGDFCKEVSEKSGRHSNWLEVGTEGGWTRKFVAEPCYADIHCRSIAPLSNVYFTFSSKDVVEIGKRRLIIYYQWLLNESFLADYYETKDPREGLKYGFGVKTEIDITLFKVASIALREPIEQQNYLDNWFYLRRKGFSNLESYILLANIYIEDGFVYNIDGDGHRALPGRLKTSFYKDLPIKKKGKSLYKDKMIGYFSVGKYISKDQYSKYHFSHIHYPFPNKGSKYQPKYKPSKKLFQFILTQLKD